MRAKPPKHFSISPRLLPSSPIVPPWRNAALPGEYDPEEFMTDAQKLIDDIEQALERQRNLDPALRASMIARLDQLRALTK
jgi:hypothetical protein